MSISPSQYSTYTDIQGVASLKAMGKQNPDQALEEIAEQFEALFLQSMLKAMRKASLGDGIFDNDQSRMYRDFFDQQIAIEMAQRRQAGIADAIVRQLKSNFENKDSSNSLKPEALDQIRLQERIYKAQTPGTFEPEEKTIDGFSAPRDFIEKLTPLAEKHSRALGVAPDVLLAQAALETGWGKFVIKHADGRSTYNLFNIKADTRWDGPSAAISTLEFEGGIPVRRYSAFRAYSSFEASFQDYVDFLRSNPRYQEALTQTHDAKAFIHALQDAGYATDPEYSRKINRIMAGGVFGDG